MSNHCKKKFFQKCEQNESKMAMFLDFHVAMRSVSYFVPIYVNIFGVLFLAKLNDQEKFIFILWSGNEVCFVLLLCSLRSIWDLAFSLQRV